MPHAAATDAYPIAVGTRDCHCGARRVHWPPVVVIVTVCKRSLEHARRVPMRNVAVNCQTPFTLSPDEPAAADDISSGTTLPGIE